LQPTVQTVWLFPGEQDLGAGASEHGQTGSYRDRVTQSHGTLGRCNADPLIALASEELRALVGVVAQSTKDRSGCGQQTVLTGGRCQLAEPGSQDETTLHVTCHETVVLQGYC
jgi:hypothetical protein